VASIAVPQGNWWAAYGTWPILLVMAVAVYGSRGAGLDGVLITSLLLGSSLVVGRTALWLRHRRHNMVRVTGNDVTVINAGHATTRPTANVVAATWHFGFWSPTFDRFGNYSAVELRLSDGEVLETELLLPTRRLQRAGLIRLAAVLPVETWTLNWPHGIRPSRTWRPGEEV
jgi:hypothetical protein